jgi:hypothetical protein
MGFYWPCLPKGKDIVFRFIIEYSSLMDFWPLLGNNNRSIFLIWGFFERPYFGLCWNLRLVIQCYNILKGFWFLLEDFLKIIFLHGEIFEFSYNFHNLLCFHKARSFIFPIVLPTGYIMGIYFLKFIEGTWFLHNGRRLILSF